MAQDYTTISYDSSALINMGDTTTVNVTNQLVADINTLYYDMYKVGISQGALGDALDQMGIQASGSDAWTGSVWITMIKALTIECNSVAGALCCITDTMNIIDDLMNVMTTSQNAYDRLVDNCTDNPTYSGSYFSSFDYYYDLYAFTDCINVFTSMQFTVSVPGQQPQTVNGILSVLSTDSFWGGHPPMDTQTANLITTSIKGITGQFSSWNNALSELQQISAWSQPKYSSDGIATTYSQNSEINDDMNAVADQLQAATTTEQTYLSQGMTFYQQVQSEEEEDIQMLSDWDTYIVSHSGG